MRATMAALVGAVVVLSGCAQSSSSTDSEPESAQPSLTAAEVSDEPPQVAKPSEPEPTEDPEPEPADDVQPDAEPDPRSQLFLVSRVIDGDTIELSTGQAVRIVGIDTPEEGDCGYSEATSTMERLVLGKRVRLGQSDEDTDRYGRLLRYANVGRLDAGLRQIKSGHAIARYDSRDGYGRHPREERYIAADGTSTSFACDDSQPEPEAEPQTPSGCADGYSPCIQPYPPDVDCGSVDGPITVTGSDPHGLDADDDGIACES